LLAYAKENNITQITESVAVEALKEYILEDENIAKQQGLPAGVSARELQEQEKLKEEERKKRQQEISDMFDL